MVFLIGRLLMLTDEDKSRDRKRTELAAIIDERCLITTVASPF